MSRSITDGPRPKHAQLSDALAELARDRLGPDAAIPSERELMATYDVSRATVRRAIESLVAVGLLCRIQGKGTFVARPRVESQLHLASFSEEMRRRGLAPSSRLLGVRLGTPPPDVTDSLGLAPTSPAWRVERVRLADGQPMAIEQGWYSAEAFPDLDAHDLGGSLYALFAQAYGVVLDRASQTLWGESADARTARQLEAPLHTPLLVFLRLSGVGTRTVEHVVSRYRGDRYQVHMDLVGNGPRTT